MFIGFYTYVCALCKVAAGSGKNVLLAKQHLSLSLFSFCFLNHLCEQQRTAAHNLPEMVFELCPTKKCIGCECTLLT